MTREEWLRAMATKMQQELFKRNGYEISQAFRVSCGLPSTGAFGKKLKTIGEAWHPKCSGDGTAEIFISPTVSDSIKVAGVLAHELVHVCVGNENGHNKVFKKCAESIGLIGKMTATEESEALKVWIGDVVRRLQTRQRRGTSRQHFGNSPR